MILFFDTETTGKVDFRMPHDHESQPNLVQLAALLTEDDGTERASLSFVVKPEGWSIPQEAAAIHGIETELAARIGVPIRRVLMPFASFFEAAGLVVAHNIDFDASVIETAWTRAAFSATTMPDRRRFCTMKAATPVCKIPHAQPRTSTDYKWPKLEECMRAFFGEELIGAHDAMVDVRACKRVYFHLAALKVAA